MFACTAIAVVTRSDSLRYRVAVELDSVSFVASAESVSVSRDDTLLYLVLDVLLIVMQGSVRCMYHMSVHKNSKRLWENFGISNEPIHVCVLPSWIPCVCTYLNTYCVYVPVRSSCMRIPGIMH